MMNDSDGMLVISDAYPRVQSSMLIAFGVGCIVLVCSDLAGHIYPFSLFSPIAAIIFTGALFIAFAFIFGGLQTRSFRWVFRPESIDVDLHQPLFGRRQRLSIGKGAVQSASLVEHEWESRAKTWAIAVTLSDGRKLDTPQFAEKPKAEDALARILAFAPVS